MNTNEINNWLLDRRGTFFSVETISKETNTHEKAVFPKINKLKGNKGFVVKIEKRGVKNRPTQLCGYLAKDHILKELLEDYNNIKNEFGEFSNPNVVSNLLVAKQVRLLLEEMKSK